MYDPSVYEARRRGLTDNYSATSAMRAYSQFLGRQQSQRGLVDLNTNFNRQAPRMVSSYGQRGLVGPGVRTGAFAKAMQDFAQQRVRQTSEYQTGIDQQEYGYGLMNRQAETGFNASLQDMEAEKARQIQQDAEMLMRQRAGVYA